jgi:hypothetical protein
VLQKNKKVVFRCPVELFLELIVEHRICKFDFDRHLELLARLG